MGVLIIQTYGLSHTHFEQYLAKQDRTRERMRNLAAIVCCVLVALLQPLWCAQCMPKELKPCVAQCNGTSFDLSNVFVFP